MTAADLATLAPELRVALARALGRLLRPEPIANYVRVSRAHHRDTPLEATAGPSRFSPRAHIPAANPPFKVLYLAENLCAALYETVVRDRFDLLPDRVLEPEHYSDHVAFEISTRPGVALALLDLTGANASKSGVPTDVLHHSKHDAGQHFAEFVRSEMPDIDGILYESRFTRYTAVAVFDHAADLLAAIHTEDLDRLLVQSALSYLDITVR